MFVAGDSAAVCGRLRGFVSLIYIMPRRHYQIKPAELEQFRAFRLAFAHDLQVYRHHPRTAQAVKWGMKSLGRAKAQVRCLGGLLCTTDIGVVHGRGVLCDANVPEPNTPIIMPVGEVVIAARMTNREALMSYNIPDYPLLALCFAYDDTCNIGKYINSAQGHDAGHNVHIIWYHHVPILESTQAIVPGTELLSTYDVP